MDDIQFSEFLDESIPLWRNDPVMFFREVLNFEPDEWQAEAARDLAANPKVSIKSGQGVGKTGLEAAVFLWFITCFPYPRIVATAPTKQQLHDVLWSEISKWMSKSELLSMLLKWTKTYVYMVGNEKRWFGVARTATKPENMQGFHEDNMLFIVDEASGVADPIMEAILGTLSGSNNKLLLCGNPTRTSGTFYDSHTRDRALYKCHTVSSADSSRTNKENIDSLIRKYGWDSNVVRVRVRGEFPNQEDDVFIPLSLIEQCSSKLLELDDSVGMISCGVIMLMIDTTTISVVCWAIPDLFDRIGCDVLIFFHGIEQVFTNWQTPTIFSTSDCKGIINNFLPTIHEVYQSAQRGCCMVRSIDMDMDTT